jgi:hypothetical protein
MSMIYLNSYDYECMVVKKELAYKWQDSLFDGHDECQRWDKFVLFMYNFVSIILLINFTIE